MFEPHLEGRNGMVMEGYVIERGNWMGERTGKGSGVESSVRRVGSGEEG